MTPLQQHVGGLVTVVAGVALIRWATQLSSAYPFYMGFDKSVMDFWGAVWIRVCGALLVVGGLSWLLTGW